VSCLRFRVRSRDGFRYGSALGAFSPADPGASLSRHPDLQRARPPSPPIVTPCVFRAGRRHALLWIKLPPDGFCNFTSDARTRSRAPDSRVRPPPPRIRRCVGLARALPVLFYGTSPSPLEEEAKATSRSRSSEHAPRGAASTPRGYDPESIARSRRRLRAALDPTSACGDGC